MTIRRILFVWSSAEFSTWDVARGYRAALERRREFVLRDYRLYARMRYHAKALGERADNVDLLSRIASEGIIVEALKHRADLVFIVSGMALHPDAVWYLRRVGIPAAVLFTESPYDDGKQREFHAVYPDMICFTTERTSAVGGWRYLAHAYDPDIHYPRTAGSHCDVLFIGTLWRERIQLLEAVDWSGIALKLIGTWVAPPAPAESPLQRFYSDHCVRNDEAPGYYASAAVCLNPFRAHSRAESLNPRAYELAACESFQMLDHRAEIEDVFGKDGSCSVVTFTADSLEERIRYWLAHEAERKELAKLARAAVRPHTFDARLDALLGHLK